MQALIDGPTTSVPRQQFPYRNLILTPYTIAKLPRGAGSGAIKKAVEKAGVTEKWEASGWAKKLAARQSRKVRYTLPHALPPRRGDVTIHSIPNPSTVPSSPTISFSRLRQPLLTRRSPTTLSDSRSSSPRGRDGTSSERRTSRRRRLRLKRRASSTRSGDTLRLYARRGCEREGAGI